MLTAVEMKDLMTDLVVMAVGPVRLVELNRPEQLNAMSEELHSGLASVWDDLAADPEARVVVLTGRGRAFSAGGNLDTMTRVQRDAAFREQQVDEARRIITGMVRCPLPVIAAVNGPAVGLGCSLALLSDLVLIADDAYVADPHVQVGLVAGDGGAYVLPLLVGMTRAKELLFLGDRVSAEDAVRLGIANRAVPKDKLMDEAMDLAGRLAAQPAQALHETKRAVNRHLEQALDTVMEPALLAERDTMHGPDHIAAVERIIASRGRR
ncbi:enoyl-CoA hydratase/isomerase family protein [Streptomyces sp. NPDC006365]|uniref:enoyl-CoA hydratase/isomerase family protein n=1 Tax=Streptomyces sp. NPDC006365 TaxID=3364744 RepID=UPI00369243F7